MSFAELVESSADGSRLAVHGANGKLQWSVPGDPASAKEAARGINVALAHRYASVADFPDALRKALEGVAFGFPLHGLLGLAKKDQMVQIVELYRQLPVEDLHVRHIDPSFEAQGTVRGLSVSLFYNPDRDRADVVANVPCPHGNIEVVWKEKQRSLQGNGWREVTTKIAVNGEANRDAFRSLPNHHRILDAIERLRLRRVNLFRSGVRAVARDGLRELRDPKAQLAAMLDLVVEIGEALRAVER